MEGVLLTPGTYEAEKALRDAVASFDAGSTPAGRAATAWLTNDAVKSYPSVVTRLVLVEGRIAGYVAVTPGEVELSGNHRKKLGLIHPIQGATLIPWLGKDVSGLIPGTVLLEIALGVAREAAKLQGGAALVLDPFDLATSQMWVAPPYEFKRSRTINRSGLHRLWKPLFRPEERR
ncbi:MAG: hypothetical protein M3141_06950 [Actinomycetota bacterium]|nr:hypothetical protein [Actinomycetota bacterium]